MQAQTDRFLSEPEEVTCDCGTKYTTRIVRGMARDFRCHPICPACTAKMPRPRPTNVSTDVDAIWRRLCPPGYQDTVASRLPCGMAMAARIEAWRPAGGRGLLITGDTNRGKTRLCWLAARAWIRAGVDVEAVDDPTLSVSYSDALGAGRGMDFLHTLLAPRVLMWDDFGKASATPRYRELAYIVIEKRMAALKPMIVTTQLDGLDSCDLFGNRDGSAIVRRLRECCECIPI